MWLLLLLFFFGDLRLLLVKCLRQALLLTSLFRLHLPILLQLSAVFVTLVFWSDAERYRMLQCVVLRCSMLRVCSLQLTLVVECVVFNWLWASFNTSYAVCCSVL